MPKRVLTEEQKQKLRDQLAAARARKAERLAAAAERGKAKAEETVELADFEREALDGGVLTLDDILAARLEAKQKVMLEQKAAAKKRLAERMVENERRSAGLIPEATERQKWLSEIVSYTVRLPKQGPRDQPEHRIDGKVFTNGRTYQVTRAEYQSLIATEQAAWHHQAQIKGESRTYYDELLGSMVYQGGVARGSGGMA